MDLLIFDATLSPALKFIVSESSTVFTTKPSNKQTNKYNNPNNMQIYSDNQLRFAYQQNIDGSIKYLRLIRLLIEMANKWVAAGSGRKYKSPTNEICLSRFLRIFSFSWFVIDVDLECFQTVDLQTRFLRIDKQSNKTKFLE